MADEITGDIEIFKKNVKNSHEYFKHNYAYFNHARFSLYNSTLDNTDLAVLSETQKPQIEFNIGEAYVSRLLGEFAKHEPSIETSQRPGRKVMPELIDVIDGHMRYIFQEACRTGVLKQTYEECLSGGYSAIKVVPDYASPMSFDYNIFLMNVFDPTLCGWDPLSRTKHMGDGSYCFELTPKKLEDAQEEFGVDIKNVTFTREMGGFSWYYQSGSEKIVMIADYYYKKKKREKVVLLADKQIMLAKEYKKFLERWNAEGRIEAAPAIVNEKMENITRIYQCIISGNEIIEEHETPYTGLPIVFMDGNSKNINDTVTGGNKLYVRGYLHNIRGTQKLKNFAGQCLANELENMIQHKIMAPKEGVPENYLEAYQNFQKANCLIYNAYFNGNPEQPLPPPREIVRTPIPPEITNTFTLTDQMAQTILGNFDADLARLSQQEISGIAIQEAVTLSNASAMPYLINYMQSMTQCATLALGLIPKYFITPRTIPIQTKEGQRYYVDVNEEGQVKLDYNPEELQISVEAGVNFTIQKTRALQQLIFLMKASPLFQEFMNQEGLPVLLDNIDMRGIEHLKQVSEEYMEKVKAAREAQQGQQQAAQQQAMAQQQQVVQAMQMEMEKLKLEKEELSQKIEEFTANLHFKIAEMQAKQNQFDKEIQIEEAKIVNDRMKMQVDADIAHRNAIVQEDKAGAEIYAKNAELAMSVADRHLKHKEMLKDEGGNKIEEKE